MSEETIFVAALERAAPAERATYLEAACAGDPDLRRRVEALLRAHDQSGDLLDPPVREPGPRTEHGPAPDPGGGRGSDRPITEGPGSQIGPYRLVRRIGEGGMGVVFLAEQEAPVRRTVALKVIKPGMDTAQVIARLEAERQALALMDHPNIARFLDAGATGSGRPYFVMEAVGRPADHRVLRPQPADADATARAVRARLPGDPARASEGDHPPRYQAVQRAGDRPGRPGGAQGDRLRRGQGDRSPADRADTVHAARA